MRQRTDEWIRARLGKVTSSRIADVVARTKSGYSASRANYAAELIAERLTGTPASSGYINPSMQWGIDNEAKARIAYEWRYDATVVEVGLIDHPRLSMCAASPDGLVGDDGLIEIKCPNTSTHIDTLLTSTIEHRYVLQMQWQLACTERRWCDFVSFDPRLPEPMQLFVQRVARDDELIATLEQEASIFLREIDETIAKLQRKYGA